ncbi:P-loop containing nucleoside triphosphate hydrolase protein [Gaertneriomyces semiglobifer]|nr:P-loop containing nucleoside triphosphate hydrolase protein [Gaertneriomyces semiglobifer]
MDIASEDELDDAAVSCEAKVEKGLQSADMSAWAEVPLDRKILASLANLGFTRPTEIQARTLPFAIEHKRDIIGAAETGSGKTLAFGLPMLQHIVESGDTNRRKLTGLILTPTRELAIQVVDMLKKVAQWAKVVAVVGGMSVEKQKRQVARHPHIIVATPGRLWELMSDDEPFLSLLKTTHFLAIDEADRMLSAGHFRELDQILSSISISDSRQLKRRTYIFSATLSSTPTLHAQFNKKSHPKRVQEGSMESLLNRLEFLDPKPLYVNVLREGLTARGLEERRIECLHTEKETYLYYILKSFPARTLLFANSIDTIRRLIPLLTLLNIPAFPLHAEMQQRQRLKNLDRFKSAANAVLVASDVAARGLDIPAVEQVVHFQLPRSADLYVHRSGRTARSTETGLSIMLISPAEVPIYKKICNILNKSDGGIPELPVPLNLIGGYKKRVTLAQKIDTLQHRTQKQSFEDAWMKKAAEEMDIIFDEDFVNAPSKQAAKKEKSDDSRETTAEVRKLKAQLADLLQQEVSARGGQSILGMKGDGEQFTACPFRLWLTISLS